MRVVPKIGAASTRSSGKTCLFCERGGKMSKEHLWPKWAQAAITPAQRGQRIRNALHDGPGEPYDVWEAPVFEATLKGGSVLEPTRDPRVAGCDHRIWPVSGMFTWPSGDALSDADLAIYTGPQVKGTSTSRLIYPT